MRSIDLPGVLAVGLTIALTGAAFPIEKTPGGASPGPQERTVEVTYRFSIRNIPGDAKQIAAWVPVPPSNPHQSLEGIRFEGNWEYTILMEPEYGNRFVRLDLSDAAQKKGGQVDVEIIFSVNRKAYRALEESGEGPSVDEGPLPRFLAPDRLIPIDGKIAEEARRVACASKDPLTCARILYDHIIDTLTYDKRGKGWGRGNALYACEIRKGNCTDFHSLFIGEARALGIPSRFIMGLPLPEGKAAGKIPGYHCWAEFYVKGKGWIPLDASEAHKFPNKRKAFFGGLDTNRIEFTVGRDIQIPGASGSPLNYVIYPHVEVDGETHTAVETRFSFRDVDAHQATRNEEHASLLSPGEEARTR